MATPISRGSLSPYYSGDMTVSLSFFLPSLHCDFFFFFSSFARSHSHPAIQIITVSQKTIYIFILKGPGQHDGTRLRRAAGWPLGFKRWQARDVCVFPAWSDPNSSCSHPTFALHSIWIPISFHSDVWKQICPVWWSDLFIIYTHLCHAGLWRAWRPRDVGVLNESALHIIHPIQEVVCLMTYFYARYLKHMTELFLLREKKKKKKRKLFEEALKRRS